MVPMSEDVLMPVAELPWIPMIDGIDFKLLRISPEIGTWTVILRCAKGSSFPAHKHLGAGEYYVLKGAMHYRAGTATSNCYGYEPIGTVHEGTNFSEDTELLFTNHGPVLFLEEDGSFSKALDYEAVYNLATQFGNG